MPSVAWIGVGVYQILANFLQSAINHSCQIGIKDFNNFSRSTVKMLSVSRAVRSSLAHAAFFFTCGRIL